MAASASPQEQYLREKPPRAVNLIVYEYDCNTSYVALHTSSMPTRTTPILAKGWAFA